MRTPESIKNKRAVWYRKRSSGNKSNYIYTFREDTMRVELYVLLRPVECPQEQKTGRKVFSRRDPETG